jgi:two-component system, response regulator PdtaR
MSIAVPRPPIVLVVVLLRMDAVDIVRNAGFEAIEAANADQAIAIIEADPDIHIVFTDVQMPGTMDGLRLARFIRDRWPPIKIVATSGRLRVAQEDLPKGSIFVPKPYTPEQIIRTFRQLTDSDGETIAGPS